MSIIMNPELSFADGYYRLDPRGVVIFKENTPQEIIDRFWKEWVPFHKKVTERQEQGIFSSRYSILPFDDPVENRKHYG